MMTNDITPFLTVFQSYQDDASNETPFTVGKNSSSRRSHSLGPPDGKASAQDLSYEASPTRKYSQPSIAQSRNLSQTSDISK